MKLSSMIGLFLIIFLWGCAEKESRESSDTNQSPDTATGQIKESENLKGSPNDVDSAYRMQFEKAQSYSSTDEVVVGQIATFTVDERSRVYIADWNQTTIHVFNPDGRYLTSLGRQGQGPGEFTDVNLRTFMEIYSDRLYVADFMEGYYFFPTRVQVFALDDLSFSHTMKLIAENRKAYTELEGYHPIRFYPYSDGRFLVAYRRSQFEYKDGESFIRYVVQDSTGNIISGPVLEQKDLTYLVYSHPAGSTHLHSFPFFGKSLLALSDEDELYAAWTEEFTIHVYDARGEQIGTIQHPFNNRPLILSELIDRYEKIDYMTELDRNEGDDVALKMISEADNIPDTWPALQTMFFDDKNRLWVSTIIDSNEVYEWWVLKDTGEVITRFEWPRDKPVEAVRNGCMYTRETDEMGVASVVRYRIRWI